MAKDKNKIEPLTEKQKIFCREYIIDWNGARAARVAGYSEKTAKEIASENLTKLNIKEYIEDIQDKDEKNAGISRLKVILEHKKIAFSSIAHLHNTWIERKEFDVLTDEQKGCIELISTKIIKMTNKEDENIPLYTEYVNIKLYDKQKALDALSKMLGYNEPDKSEINIKDVPKIKWID